jgi:hypothetical protein
MHEKSRLSVLVLPFNKSENYLNDLLMFSIFKEEILKTNRLTSLPSVKITNEKRALLLNYRISL